MSKAEKIWGDLADKQNVAKRLSPQVLLRHKRSSRLYVCATGSSVSRLPPGCISAMIDHDTIGINGWLAHPLVPTFYVTENGDMQDCDNAYLIKMLRLRAPSYCGTTMILKDSDYSGKNPLLPNDLPMSYWSNIVLSKEILINGGDRAGIAAHLRESLKSGKMLSDFNSFGIVPKRRGTAVFCIMLGYLLGYREIVLVGVDISNGRHFYELPVDADANPEPHFCESAKVGTPISQVILGIKDALFTSNGRTLSAISASDVFKGEIPEHNPEAKS